MKTVTNEEYLEAYKDLENIRVLNRASYKYKDFLDEDDLLSCQTVALWRALKNHNPLGGNSFKNSLYRFVIWECQAMLRKKRIKTQSIEEIDPVYISNSLNLFF